MQPLFRPLLLFTILLAVPIVPLLVWGEMFLESTGRWQAASPSRPLLAAAVIAILASDILLPVPSGPVITLAGGQLGVVLATLSAWLGLTAGALVAFALVRRWGPGLAGRLVDGQTLQRWERACGRHAVTMLIATRPIPILAEATVLLLGLCRCDWRRFTLALAAGNLVVSATWAGLGDYAARQGWLPMALAFSLAAGLAMWAVARRA